jgi:hypothetical protein
MAVPGRELLEFEGTIGVPLFWVPARLIRADDGLALQQQLDDDGSVLGPSAPLAFYAADRALVADGPLQSNRVDFLRDDAGDVRWVRFLGRVFKRLPGS